MFQAMRFYHAMLLVMLAVGGCMSPEPKVFPVETRFIINTSPQGAHIILASPQGYPPKYLGTTPLNEGWSKVVQDETAIPRNFYVLAIKDGFLTADQRIEFVNQQPTVITLILEKGAPTVLTRSAFESYSKGLSIEDLKAIWGPPISTTSKDGRVELYYSGITYDRLSESVDRNIQVITTNGRVHEVNFY